MAEIWSSLSLTPSQGAAFAAICFLAGLIRGFTGFALSAFGMALAVLIIPPIELIPVMWLLGLASSFLMLTQGFKGADLKAVVILVAGSAVGLIVGLNVTTQIDPVFSQRLALCILITLAVLQLFKIRIPHLASTAGTLITGIIAGIAAGLAGVGGLVVALYVLARNDPPAHMRATLIAFIFLDSIFALFAHLWFGTINGTSSMRALAFVLPCLLGVLLGQRLFTPRFQPYYRPLCLTLLIGLGVTSLMRSII